MKKLFFLSLSIWLSTLTYAQTYTETHKEIEYTFGIIAENDLNTVSEIEKIKYEFRQMERSVSRTINSSYETTLDITIDHNDHNQEWMNPATRFLYTPASMTLFDADNNPMDTMFYSEDEAETNTLIQNDIQENGYHPGIVLFPTHSDDIEEALEAEGINVLASGDTAMTLTYGDGTIEVYNFERLTITRIWIDDNGIQNIETSGYVPYGENNGYLLQAKKRERFLQSVNGPCITEILFTYYADYVINDDLGLIEQAMNNANPPPVYALALSPNPNDGTFSVTVALPADDAITQTTITNMITSYSFNVNDDNNTTFSVNMQDQPDGNYVIQVYTNQTLINSHFIKTSY